MTSTPGNDDGLDMGRRRDFRGEFRQMVRADPLLARLAEHSYPHLRLRSTFLLGAATLLLAVLTQNMVMAAVIGVLVLAGHAAVVHLIAVHDDHGSKVLVNLIRGGCALVIVLIVGSVLTGPEGSAEVDRRDQQTLQQPGGWPASGSASPGSASSGSASGSASAGGAQPPSVGGLGRP